MTTRVGFLTTHPIQYQVPLFRLLENLLEIDLTVFYCMIPDEQQQGDGFGVKFQWDVPLLDGYKHVMLENVSANPTMTSFKGCDTPGIQKALQERQIDVLIVNGWVVKSCLQGLRAAKKLKIPCIVRGEANNLRPRAWWKRMGHRLLVNQYSGCLYIGEASRQFYKSHGVADKRLFFSPYCIENHRFSGTRSDHPEVDELRKQFGIQQSDTTFLFCGKFEHKKHPLELVQAFRELHQQRPNVHLLMVGDGELRKQCEEYVQESQIPVHFAGFVNQSGIPNYYAAADCLALPSNHGETWGLVVNEAMASGLTAIVSSQVGCHLDLIQDGVTGWVFEYGNQVDLVAKLLLACDDQSRLSQMGLRAKAKVVEYAPHVAVEGIRQAVESVRIRNGSTTKVLK